jgi:hypothetical protein
MQRRAFRGEGRHSSQTRRQQVCEPKSHARYINSSSKRGYVLPLVALHPLEHILTSELQLGALAGGIANMSQVVVAFDLYGTLLSTASVAKALAEHFGEDKANSIAKLWRTYQLEYTWRLNSMSKIRDVHESS